MKQAGRSALWAPLLCAAVVWGAWLLGMTLTDRWGLLSSHGFMGLTMAVGSFIAGATSEGGGAVAFPAMTLLFGIAPSTARDFSLLIQSVGMSAASLAILSARTPIVRRCILPVSLGGVLGLILGLRVIAPWVSPPLVKMLFVSTWLAFGVALLRAYRNRGKAKASALPQLGGRAWLALLGVGILGGIGTGLTGSGLDLLTFSVLVLHFGICERIATPTSVVLMAINAIFGSGIQGVAGALDPEAWSFWWVCVPVVVVGAPLGARFIQGRSRGFIVGLLLVSIAVQFLAAVFVIPQTVSTLALSATVFGVGSVAFWLLGRGGPSLAIATLGSPQLPAPQSSPE
jgi:uncharacterized membrane protein YfcA